MSDPWRRFQSNTRPGCVRFDLMGDPPRFLRIRDRSRDDRERGNAFIVVDLWSKRVLESETVFVPKKVTSLNGHEKG
jgi:hypothetical protein